jgi:hypothetical protein
LAGGLLQGVAKLRIGLGAAGNTYDSEAIGEPALAVEAAEGRDELAVGQIAAGAKDN